MGQFAGTSSGAPSPGHITLAFKHECSNEEVNDLKVKTERTFNGTLPIQCFLGELIKVGPKCDMDAYKVHIHDPNIKKRTSKFFLAEQRRAKGQETYDFNPHITLNTAEKRDAMDLLKENGGLISINQIVVRTLADKAVLFTMHSDCWIVR